MSWELSKRNYGVLRPDGALDVYCDSPADLAERMAALAGAGPGVRALEPSAGRGAIAKVLRGLGAEVFCGEIGSDLAAGLEAEGFPVELGSFTHRRPDPTFDVVVMNPPFGDNRDFAHIRHGLRFLRPGGLLVSTLSRATAESAAFGIWLQSGNGGRPQEMSRIDLESERWYECEGAYSPAFDVVHGPELLPEETFRAVGVNVLASLLVLRRR